MKKIHKLIMSLLMLLCVSFGISPYAWGQASDVLTSTPAGNQWVMPPGVSTYTIKLWGAGGGGGNTPGTDGQGGGGGGAFHKVSLTADRSAGGALAWGNVNVGVGGTAGNPGTPSTISVFANTISAAGGAGSNTGNGFGGAGAVQVAQTPGLYTSVLVNSSSANNGGNGGASTNPFQTTFGGGGGGRADDGVNGGNGGPGGTSGSGSSGTAGSPGGGAGGITGGVGNNATSYGGGGGGRGGGGANSGTGGDGRIEISWTCVTLNSVSYSSAPFCNSTSATATISPAGAYGGAFTSSTLSGAFLNVNTGAIAVGAPVGTHTITYAWGSFYGCPAQSVSTTISIGQSPSITTFTYATPFCTSITTAVSPSLTAVGATGTFSYTGTGTLGSFNSTNGSFNPSSSTPGSYSVTYTIPSNNGCPSISVSRTVVVTALPTITGFDYPPAGSPNKYCAGAGIQLPTSTVTNPNNNVISYSYLTSPGLSLNTSTGAINPATSTPGVYIVTMLIASGGGCAAVTATSTVEILARPTATIAYLGNPFCQTVASTTQVITISSVTGGPLTTVNFSYTTAPGLTLNTTSGAIDLNSTPGTYIVKYRFTGVNGCLDSSSTSVTIKPRPTATISYAGAAIICSNISPVVAGNITAVGAWTITLSNGQTATGTGSGPWSIAVNTLNPGQTATYSVTSLVDANCSGVVVPDMPGSVTITKRTVTSGSIPTAANIKVCEGLDASINVTLTSSAQCAPNPQFSGIFKIEKWNGATWVFQTNYPWSLTVGPSTTGIAAAIAIPASNFSNVTSNTILYRVSWVSLVDCNGCSADPLTGSVVIESVPTADLTISASPTGDVCPGSNIVFTVNQTTNIPNAVFNWEATDANGNVIGSGSNVSFGTNAVNTNLGLSCPFNGLVTFTFNSINPNCCNCIGAPIVRTVMVRDIVKPTWLTTVNFLNKTLECNDAAGLAAAQLLKPVAADNCDNDVTNIVKVSGNFVASVTCPQAGTYTNTWTVADDCGNVSAVYTQVITIIDTQAPTWITLANALNGTFQCSDAAGISGAQALFPVAQDNCDANVTNIVKVSGAFVASVTCPQAGTYTNTWTVKDDCGNTSAVFTQVITIIDTQAPTWLTAIGNLNRTLECSDAAGLTAAQALIPVAVDNCDANVLNIVKVSGAFVASVTCPQAGTYTNTWTVKDDCGNTSVVYTQVITIQDTQAPTWITAVGNLNRTLECSDAAGLTAAQALIPVAQDNCDANVLNIVKISGAFVASVTCPQAGTYTNTWTVKDDCGNTSVVYTQVITIQDTQAPTWITAVSNLNRTLECSNTIGIAAAQALFPVAQDNCDASVTNIVKVSGAFVPTVGCPQSGTYTNTWTVKDDCGNTSVVFTQVITITDLTAPVLTGVLPLGSTGLGINGCIGSAPAGPTAAAIALLYTDNCGTVMVTKAGAVTGTDCAWTVTYVYTVKDNCGNTVSPSPSITYFGSDRSAPVFTSVIPTQTINTGAGIGCSGVMPDYRSLVTYTDCSSTVTLTQLAPNAPGTGVFGYNGTRDLAIEAKDACGNKDTIRFTVLLKDLTPPVVLCKNWILNLDANGNATLIIPNINNGTYDNCTPTASLILALSKTSFNCSNVGVNLVKLYATDLCGNIDSCIATVTVRDTTKPVISCWGDTTINKDANCTHTIPDLTFRVNKSDACGIATVTQFPIMGSIMAASIMSMPVTITVTDVNGNVSICTFLITYKDVTAPVIIGCPSNIIVNTGLGNTTCSAPATWVAPTATDACIHCCTTQTIVGSHVSGAIFPVGVTTVTYTATDIAGNVATCTFTVTVVDNTKPIIVGCPTANVTANTGAGATLCSATATWTEPTATDNCTPAANLVRYRSHAPGSIFPVGTTVVKYAFRDLAAAPNTSDTCTFNVVVTDNTVPVIACPVNIVNPPINTAGCLATVATANPTISDNCAVTKLTWAITGAGITPISTSPTTGINYLGSKTFNFGVTTVTYTATDAAGNIATCSFTVSVTRPLAATIAGTSTVLQNISGTSTVSFTATGGTAPYIFVYTTTAGGFPSGGTHSITTNGLNSSTIGGNANSLVTTVPQSNAVAGVYTYTLVSVTDAFGCVVNPNTTAVITVQTNVFPRPDFTPSISSLMPTYLQPTGSAVGFIEISNISNNPSSSTIIFNALTPLNFSLNIGASTTSIGGVAVDNSNFNIVSYPGIGYSITSKTGVIIPGNSTLKIGYTVSASGNELTGGRMSIILQNGTGGPAGGDDNNSNNRGIIEYSIVP